MTGALTLVVGDLLRRSGRSRETSLKAVLDDLVVLGTRVPEGEPVQVELRLESVNEGIVATGTVRAPWESICRRCLRPVADVLEVPVMEVFEADPTEGETLPLDGVDIDVEPVAREAVLLGLPLAPVCREDCQGLCASCGIDRNEADCDCAVEVADHRWAALDELRFDTPEGDDT
ncbi:MAG TPA: DUF177 domain-containing protein [Acidimicrobiales bacterium]|nr:DUF177 domain-containing protein [Acidimicrobiales bacterium]